MMNLALQKFLLEKNKEKSGAVCFVLRSGILKGNFVNYDFSRNIVTIANASFSGVNVDMKIDIPTESIYAWGKA